MIKFLLRLPAVALAIIIVEGMGGGDAAQIFAGFVAAFLAEILISSLRR